MLPEEKLKKATDSFIETIESIPHTSQHKSSIQEFLDGGESVTFWFRLEREDRGDIALLIKRILYKTKFDIPEVKVDPWRRYFIPEGKEERVASELYVDIIPNKDAVKQRDEDLTERQALMLITAREINKVKGVFDRYRFEFHGF